MSLMQDLFFYANCDESSFIEFLSNIPDEEFEKNASGLVKERDSQNATLLHRIAEYYPNGNAFLILLERLQKITHFDWENLLLAQDEKQQSIFHVLAKNNSANALMLLVANQCQKFNLTVGKTKNKTGKEWGYQRGECDLASYEYLDNDALRVCLEQATGEKLNLAKLVVANCTIDTIRIFFEALYRRYDTLADLEKIIADQETQILIAQNPWIDNFQWDNFIKSTVTSNTVSNEFTGLLQSLQQQSLQSINKLTSHPLASYAFNKIVQFSETIGLKEKKVTLEITKCLFGEEVNATTIAWVKQNFANLIADPTNQNSNFETLKKLPTYYFYCRNARKFPCEHLLKDYIAHLESLLNVQGMPQDNDTTSIILDSKAKKIVETRKAWSDVVSVTYSYNENNASFVKKSLFERLKKRGANNPESTVEKLVSYLQLGSKIIVAFNASFLNNTDTPPDNELKNVFQSNNKNRSKKYIEKRDVTEKEMYCIIANNIYKFDIYKLFEDNTDVRPRYAAFRLLDHQQGLGPVTNYGKSFIILDDLAKLNSLVVATDSLDYYSKNNNPLTPSTYYHLEQLLLECSDEMLDGLIYRVNNGKFPDNYSQQYITSLDNSPGYIEVHLPMVNIFDTKLARHIHIDSSEFNRVDQETIDEFAKAGITLTTGDKNPYISLCSEFKIACQNKDYGEVKRLVKRFPVLSNIPDAKGDTPLMLAIDLDQNNLVNDLVLAKILLSHGTNPASYLPYDILSTFFIRLASYNVDILRLLLGKIELVHLDQIDSIFCILRYQQPKKNLVFQFLHKCPELKPAAIKALAIPHIWDYVSQNCLMSTYNKEFGSLLQEFFNSGKWHHLHSPVICDLLFDKKLELTNIRRMDDRLMLILSDRDIYQLVEQHEINVAWLIGLPREISSNTIKEIFKDNALREWFKHGLIAPSELSDLTEKRKAELFSLYGTELDDADQIRLFSDSTIRSHLDESTKKKFFNSLKKDLSLEIQNEFIPKVPEILATNAIAIQSPTLPGIKVAPIQLPSSPENHTITKKQPNYTPLTIISGDTIFCITVAILIALNILTLTIGGGLLVPAAVIVTALAVINKTCGQTISPTDQPINAKKKSEKPSDSHYKIEIFSVPFSSSNSYKKTLLPSEKTEAYSGNNHHAPKQ